MNCLESIVRNNRAAVAAGVIKAGTAVGTEGHDPDRFITKGHDSVQGGLRGHSIGEAYPYSAVGGIDEQGTNWTVTNLLDGKTHGTWHGNNACTLAHAECERLKRVDVECEVIQQQINESKAEQRTRTNYNLAA